MAVIATAASGAPADHTRPVFQLHTAADNLWDPTTGIYVNFLRRGSAWEREAVLDIDGTGGLDLGLRIHGGRSRRYAQKSLRLYVDHGAGPIDHDFFGSPPTIFARLILRSNQTPARCLHTNLAESLFQDLGHLGSRQSLVVVYLDDRYWGLYTLKERFDEAFATVTHALGSDFALIRDGETQHGDAHTWWSFLDSFRHAEDRTSPQWFNNVQRHLDLASYLDWLIINIFGAAADNGGAHNLSLLQVDGGPWRFLMWDEDDLFHDANLRNDHFRWFAATSENEYRTFQPPVQITGTWQGRRAWSALFHGLMQNEEFRLMFGDRVAELLDGVLSPASLNARLDTLMGAYAPEIVEHARRWEWSDPGALARRAEDLSTWFAARQTIVRAQLADFLDRYPSTVEIQWGATDDRRLHLNEFMAANHATLRDEAGQYDDWVEIYNAGAESVNLDGLYLTDDLSRPTRWALPPVTLAPGAFLVVWCDDDPDQGPLHATFKLNADGEQIGLFESGDVGAAMLDQRVFGPQRADISEARDPDGGPIWRPATAPTPGTSNRGF